MLTFAGTLGGTASNYVTATMPFTLASFTGTPMQYCDIGVGGTFIGGKVLGSTGTNVVRFYKQDESNFSLAAHGFQAHFFVRT